MLSNKMTFQEIEESQSVTEKYRITPEIYEGFLKLFKDTNPLHVDESYARAAGFEHKVMHGSILNGFVSHFVGMKFPGERCLLLSSDLRFQKPVYLNDEIEAKAVVQQKVDSQNVVILDFSFHNLTQNVLAAKGRVMVKVRDDV